MIATNDNTHETHEFDATVLAKLHPETGRLLGWMATRQDEAPHFETTDRIGVEIDADGGMRLLAPGAVWDAAKGMASRLATGTSRFAVAGETGVPAAFVGAFVEGMAL
ncbi:MAG: hypothetical protein OEL76_03920 [Siculibacillus sp.]|nr:hypothetical protein [Siculibacillus sp.]